MPDSNLSEFRSEVSESRSQGRRVNSVAAVRPLTREIGDLLAPNEGWQQQVTAVHRKLTDKKFDWCLENLTWNRVKTWFFGEARRVDFDELTALRELKAREEALREHQQFVAITHKLVVAMAAEGAAFSGAQVAALARIAGGSADHASDYHARQGGTFRGMAGSATVEAGH